MRVSFTCVNKSYDNVGPLYICDTRQLEKLDDTYINLSCYVDDFFFAVKELSKIKNKVINYFIKISENILIENYENLFDTFKELMQYKNNILGIELNLSTPIKNSDFQKLTEFLQCIPSKLDFRLNLGNLDVLNNEQINALKNVSKNLDVKIKVNQSYQGGSRENNGRDNIYTLDSLINIKNKIDKIINKIPTEYSDVEKVLFLYRYLGKKVKYSKTIAKLDYEQRETYDLNSIYEVLFNCRGVCSGFATTFRILMNKIGIPCQVVGAAEHEWNVVKIRGAWYHLDLTWDLDNIKNNNELTYFLKSEKHILKDSEHQICTYYAPQKEIAARSMPVKIYIK